MNLLVLALLTFASATAAEIFDDIDWPNVLPVRKIPGFWDGREIKPIVNHRDPSIRAARIVGGEIVIPHSIPFQAGLLLAFAGQTALCGGSVISQRAILTAAHCPVGTTSVQVRLGAHVITTIEPTQTVINVGPSNYRIHASYNPSNLNNDIAILITPATFAYNQWIQPANLALATAGTFAGELATVSGWGRFSDSSSATSTHLRAAQNLIITNAQCAQSFGGVIIASTICQTSAGGRGACNSDSGGPLTVPASGTTPLQVGVVSFGSSQCEDGRPGGFARVSSFRPWINTNMIP